MVNPLEKYRPIDDAKIGELENIRKEVLQDKDYRPKYHIYPETGLLNDPNGLTFDGDKYHIFYQWFPFDSTHGMKHWAHITTKDFIDFEICETLIPKEDFEKHGCYSGGALTIGDELYCFYTGNTRQGENLDRVSYQNLAIIDKNTSKVKSKHCLATTPKGFTEHFRDPRPWIEDGNIKFICASQRDDETGTATIFSYNDEDKSSTYLGELEVEGIDNKDVFMWECPDILSIDKKDIFVWCPQGIKPSEDNFKNIYSSVYGVGEFRENKFKVKEWDEIDRGFDFYAPQTISHSEEDILIGWVGVPNAKYPSDTYKWQGALTIPRKLSVVDDSLYQVPHKNIYNLVNRDKYEVLTKETNEVKNDLNFSYIKSKVNDEEFKIDLFIKGSEKLSMSYKEGYFVLDRGNTLETDFMKNYESQRKIKLENLDNMEIFIDNSIIEIYLNNGQYVMTSRFFLENKSNKVQIIGNIALEVYEMKGITLWEK